MINPGRGKATHMDREMIAYGIIALVALIVVPLAIRGYERHRRLKLRRRGIKRYGH